VLLRPDLAIEILSPDGKPGETLERISDYLRSETADIWIVDPYGRRLFLAGPDGLRDIPELVAETALVGSVDFNTLFRQLDEAAD